VDLLKILCLLLFLSCSGIIVAQGDSNIRYKRLHVVGDTLQIDSLSIIPHSLHIPGIDPANYRLDPINSFLIWNTRPVSQTVEISYRVFQVNLASPFQRRSFDSIFYKYNLPAAQLLKTDNKDKPFDFGKLKSYGSIGRSLSFGNRQDAILNSSLNLQFSGYMGDSILLNAAIADNNIPIQPDGNTQNLNEFDQVYIQFSKAKWKLSLGDLDIRQKQLYYLNFYKRLQGVSLEHEHGLGHGRSGNLLASGAVAKGKFTTNVFQGIEGNQGPYRLKGANQELFFIVLAGTERVYIDGVMMERGEDHDYIINYNTAEITFMPNQMISKDKRIQVDFEYADRNYLNAQFILNEKITVGKSMQVTLGYFGNADAKNSPINQTLNSSQKQFLSAIGDNSRSAYFPSAIPDSFYTGKILYRKVDTLISGTLKDTVYVYEKNKANDLYALSFSDLGEGNGDYVLDQLERANGKVYKWVAPDPISGKSNGRFAPVVLLVAPKQQKVFSVAANWKDEKGWAVDADAAVSSFDLNRFSSRNDDDNTGFAGRFVVKKSSSPSQNQKKYALSALGGFEFTDARFKPVERLRSVEFYRDWGLDIIVPPANERIITGSIGIKNKTGGQLDYDVAGYFRDVDFKGTRHRLQQRMINKLWTVNNIFAITQSEDQFKKGQFLKPIIDVSRRLPQLGNQEFGVKYTLERNISKTITGAILTPSSFSFQNLMLQTVSNPEKIDKWGMRYFTRADQLPMDGKMVSIDKSRNFNVYGDWLSNQHHQLKINATYRKLVSSDYNNAAGNGSSLLGRGEYNADWWRGGITGSVLYELGGGQEPRKDFIYFEVPAGQGEFAWLDYNNDGVQQLNEFEVSQFRDQAKFIRLFTPTNEFVRTDYLQFNYSFVVNPVIAIRKKEDDFFSSILKRLFWQSTLQVNRKSLAAEKRELYPFASIVEDTTQISFDQIQSHTLSFNKLSQRWGFDLNYLSTSNKAFLSFGFETRRLSDLNLRLRSNWFKKISLELILRKKNNVLETPGFNNRNYHIAAESIEPRIAFTQGTDLRIQAYFKRDQKNNADREDAILSSVGMDLKYNFFNKTAISVKIGSTSIRYDGQVATAVGYMMLEGLQPGRNQIWNLDLTRRIGEYMELGINYEGRAMGTSNRIIHLGRAQFRALL
jgi:hypothetical protein